MQLFTKARIRLTLWYLLIIMTISMIFSLALFHTLSLEVERFARRRTIVVTTPIGLQPVPLLGADERKLVEEIKWQIFVRLLTANALVLIFAGILGYMLAGKTLEPIKQMVEEQNRFISDASHELKTPLTSLQSGIEVFLRSKKKSLTDADILLQENLLDIKRLQKLSHSLLLLAQAPTMSEAKLFEHVSLEMIVQSVLRSLARRIEAKQIQCNSTLVPVSVIGNADDLLKVVEVLIDNAIKYTPVHGTITIELVQKRRKGLLKVADSGSGIKPADQEHIFDRFYRTDDARCRMEDEGGYGLGLAIAKRIIDEHNGTLIVKNNVPTGSVFEMRIPCSNS